MGLDRLWLRGGFPRAWLARSDRDAFTWLSEYVTTFLERDVPAFGVRVAPTALRRFWMMLAHVHGQLLNLSELGRAFGLTLDDRITAVGLGSLARALRPLR